MKQNIMLYTTKNLAVRRIVAEDAPALLALSKASGCTNFPNEYFETLEEAKQEIERMQLHYQQMVHFPFRFAIVLKKENKLIGTVSLKLNSKRDIKITMMLLDEFRGKGYAKETLTSIVPFVKEKYKKEHVYAYTRVDTVAAGKLLESVGFTPMEEFEDDFFGKRILFRRYMM